MNAEKDLDGSEKDFDIENVIASEIVTGRLGEGGKQEAIQRAYLGRTGPGQEYLQLRNACALIAPVPSGCPLGIRIAYIGWT